MAAVALVGAALHVGASSSAPSALVTTTLTPVADAYVESTQQSRRYGSSRRLSAGASPTRQVFLRFDLTGVTGTLRRARLRIHAADAAGASSPSGGSVARVRGTAWTERGITYANRPTRWGPAVATIGPVRRGSWVDVPVVRAITLGGIVTIGIRSSSSDRADYDSRETGATAPRLVLTTDARTTGPPNAVAAACAGRLVATNAGTVTDGRLKEISGIDAGVVNPGLYWVHNDSGDAARVFALTPAGATRAVYTLAGANAVDWEDIAIGGGPVAGKAYIYAADIGDNARSRNEVVVYRVPEPRVTATGTFTLTGVDALRLRYPDGAHNAEALLADPTTGELVILEKTPSGGPAHVYRAPGGLRAGSLTTLGLVGTLPLPSGALDVVTGADLAPDGTELAVRTYAQVLLWNRDPAGSIWAPFARPPCNGPVPIELQGEAIAFHPDGRGYVTVSEGVRPALHQYAAR